MHKMKMKNAAAFVCEALEGRQLLSGAPVPSYTYDIIARNGQNINGTLKGFGTGPSINDLGEVAFVGQHASGDSLFVGNGSGSATNISPTFDNDPGRSFGQAVQINNTGQVVAQNRVNNGTLQSFIEVYNSSAVNSFTTVAKGDSGGLGDYLAVFQYAGINASGQTAFGALNDSGQRVLADTSGNTFNDISETGLLQPDIANNGSVVVHAGDLATAPIVLFSHSLGGTTPIATSADFSALGQAPAVSHDGLLVSFYGVLTSSGAATLNAAQPGWPKLTAGPGIFVSINTTKGWVVQQVAGVGSQFTGFSADTRVAVSNLSFTDSAASVAFLATGTDGKQGLYVSRLLLNNGSNFIPPGPPVVATTSRVLRTSLVIENGLKLTGISGTISSIGINDPLNSASTGQLAFYITTSTGQSAILRASAAAPVVVLKEATTLDSKSVDVTFTVANTAIPGPMSFDFYRSDKPMKDASSQLIGSDVLDPSLNESGVGTHTVIFIEGTKLTPNTLLPYIVAVANADGKVLLGAGSMTQTYFHTFELGVLVHGYQAPPPGDDGTGFAGKIPPKWEPAMAAALKTYDHYDYVIQDNWVTYSRVTAPNTTYGSWATAAAAVLEPMVVKEADSLAAGHLGDVVDLHFIGHSRGTVVITQCQKLLLGTKDPALEGSYIHMTLLDPHPANVYGSSQYASLSTLNIIEATAAKAIAAAVRGLTFLCRDPDVMVQSSAMQVDDYYQKTANNKGFAKTDSVEYYVNLWGQGPNDRITNASTAKIQYTDLTNVVDPSIGHKGTVIGLVGHAQVVDWYLVHVVQAGMLTM